MNPFGWILLGVALLHVACLIGEWVLALPDPESVEVQNPHHDD